MLISHSYPCADSHYVSSQGRSPNDTLSTNERNRNYRTYNSPGRIYNSRGRRNSARIDNRSKWEPRTKLGHLVQEGKITSLEQIYYHSIPIKEHEIVDTILGDKLKSKLMKHMRVNKQTRAGQSQRWKAFCIVGDENGHLGFGVKCAKDRTLANEGAKNLAKINIIPVRLGYWSSKIGNPHSIVAKASGKCGSVLVRLIPAPRGTGIVAASASKNVIQLAGVQDVYTCSKGHTATIGNFINATYTALASTYGFLTPDLWMQLNSKFQNSPLYEGSERPSPRNIRYKLNL